MSELQASPSLIAQENSNLRRCVRLEAAFLGVVSMLTIAVGDQGRPERPPERPCIEQPELSVDGQQRKALDCIASRTAKVALVAYDMSPADADVLAIKTEQTITRATEGMFKPDFVVVPPSDEAMQLFRSANQKNDNNCADRNEITNDGGVIADRVMDLDQYRMILSSTQLPDCGISVGGEMQYAGGVAYVEGGRYVSGFGIKPNDEDGHLKLAHEYLHQQGLGHASAISSRALFVAGRLDISPDRPTLIDLYSPDITYQENGGGCNIMGYSNGYSYRKQDGISERESLPNLYLNPLQRRMFEWPERVLGYKKDSELKLNDEEVLISVTPDTYATIGLENPVRLPDSTKDDSKHSTGSFDRLAIVPHNYCGQASNSLLELYLTNSSDQLIHTVDLTPLSAETSEREIIVGNKVIKIKFTEKGFLVSARPTS